MEDKDALVAALMKKLAREKQARELAEKQLERYSLDIYNTNTELQSSLLNAERNQTELKFLNDISSEISSDTSIDVLFNNTLSLISEFMETNYGFYINVTNENKTLRGQITPDGCDGEYASYLYNQLSDFLDIDVANVSQRWLINVFEHQSFPDIHWLLSTAVAIKDNEALWLVVPYYQDILDEEYLYVLDTARAQLKTGLNRRINEAKILKRNKVLQETIANLESARKQLIQSEKMASLGQLAAGVAHEINNPIGFIQSNLQTLKEYTRDLHNYSNSVGKAIAENSADESFHQTLKKTLDIDYIFEDVGDLIDSNLQGIERVSEIVLGLKTFTHGGNDKEFIPVKINEVVEQSLKIAWNSIKYDYTLNNELTELPVIQGNPGQLQQVFINLFVNAIQAMPEGGTLSITEERQANSFTIKVTDTGVGMDEKTLNQLFTPFYTTKPVGEGTGLGLSISFAILEAHNVDVNVFSEVNKGTTFSLRFPLTIES